MMRLAIMVVALMLAAPAQAGPVLDSYLPHMRTAEDWKEIGWEDQALIARELGGPNVNACMMIVADDVRYKRMPFASAIAQCVEMAKKM